MSELENSYNAEHKAGFEAGHAIAEERTNFLANKMTEKVTNEVVKHTTKLAQKHIFEFDEEDANDLGEMVVNLMSIFSDTFIELLTLPEEIVEEEKEDGNAQERGD